MKTHYRNCNICEALCGLEIKYEGDKIHSIKGDANDPFSKGHICPKALALQDTFEDSDRLMQPLKKTPEGHVAISWEEAYDLIIDKIKGIQQTHGHDAVATYLGNPNAHMFSNQLFLPFFLRSLRTKNRYSASSVDQLPHHVAAKYMFGHSLVLPVPDIDRTEFLLVIGGNPMVSNGSMMTAPNVAQRLKNIQKRGGKIVVVDPRKTETAKKADQHIFIRPGTDALLLLSLINTVFAEEKVNLNHLADNVLGLDTIKAAVQKYTPEYAAKITGIPAETIKMLAREMAASDKAICYSRMGASTQEFGGVCLWLTNVLNILTGNFDCEGGVMFPMPAFDPAMMSSTKGKPARPMQYSRVRKLPRFYGEFPVATLADEIETPGEGQIRALFTIAGNPVLSTPNGQRLEKAIESLDFHVSIDIYKNETNQYADVILPAATGLEIAQYDIAFNNLAVRNVVKYSPPLMETRGDIKQDWEILATLTERISGQSLSGQTPEKILSMGLSMGKYGAEGLTLEKLKEEFPHGMDLGPLAPCIKERIQTDESKIQLAHDFFLDDLTRLDDRYQVSETEFPFQLIGRRVLRQHNTWTHNSPRLSKGKNDCTLMIHPEDAKAIDLENGGTVQIKSRVGAIQVAAEVTTDMMPGVVCLPQGFGSRKQSGMTVAAERGGVSINDLTDEMRLDTLTGNAALNGVGVSLQTVDA